MSCEQNRDLAWMLAVIISFLATSVHLVVSPLEGLYYTDITFGCFYTRFSIWLTEENITRVWYRVDKYYTLVSGTRVSVYPYVDYRFEYPPIIGLIWAFTTNVAIQGILPEKYDNRTYLEMYPLALLVNYMLNALINSVCFGILVYTMRSLIGDERRLLFFLLPSTILFLVYNWDVICSMFLILGLRDFLQRKRFRAGVFFGLSVATKILTVFTPLVPAVILWRNRERRELAKLLSGFAVATAVPFIALYVVSPRGLMDFINYHALWYCENCLYLLFIHDIFSPLHRTLSAVSIATAVSTTLYLVYVNKTGSLYETCFALQTLVISLNYVFTPQMMLLITPLAILGLSKQKLLTYSVADVINASMIIVFFEDREIRDWMNSIGIPVGAGFNPWRITSPTQWLSLARILLLLAISVQTILFSRNQRYRGTTEETRTDEEHKQ